MTIQSDLRVDVMWTVELSKFDQMLQSTCNRLYSKDYNLTIAIVDNFKSTNGQGQ